MWFASSICFIDLKQRDSTRWVSECVWLTVCASHHLCICCAWEKDKVAKGRTTLLTPTLLPYEAGRLAAMRPELGCAPVTSGTFSLSAHSFQEWSKDFEGYLEVLWKTYVIKYFFFVSCKQKFLIRFTSFIVCANVTSYKVLGCQFGLRNCMKPCHSALKWCSLMFPPWI